MGESEKEQIESLIRRSRLEDRAQLNPLGPGVASDQALNLLYNACDVGINTSMGEGWGLVSFEHGGSGAAQVVPAHSACTELWQGRAEMIPVAKSYKPEFSVQELGEVSTLGVAQALNNLYLSPQKRQQLAQAAFESAQNPQYSWDAIADQFDNLFNAFRRT